MIAQIKSLLTGDEGLAMVIVVGFMAVSIPLLTGALALAGSLSADSRVKLEIAKSQYSNIGALEYVRYLSDTPENWDDWIEETGGEEIIEIGDDTIEIEAEGDGVSDYGVLGYCIFSTGSVEIKEDADVQCSVGSNGDVMVKEDAVIAGSLVSGGNIELKPGAMVVGDVTAGGTVTYGGAIIGGTMEQGATLAPVGGPLPSYIVDLTLTDAEGNVTTETINVDAPALPLTFSLAAGGPDVTIDEGDPCSLAPGSYGIVEVKEYANLCLTTGEYAFNRVIIKEYAEIYLDLTGGPIIFDVVDDLEFKENIAMSSSGDPSDFMVRIGDKALFKESGLYLGAYFGFGAILAEMEVKEYATLYGALYGDNVKVKEGATVIGMPALEAYLAFFGL